MTRETPNSPMRPENSEMPALKHANGACAKQGRRLPGRAILRGLSILFLAIIGLWIRICFVSEAISQGGVDTDVQRLDSQLHYRGAIFLNGGAQWSGKPVFELMSVSSRIYPEVIRAIGTVFDFDIRRMRLAFAAGGVAAIAGLLWLIGKDFSIRSAIAVGTLLMLDPALIFFHGSMHKPVVEQLLLLGILLIIVPQAQRVWQLGLQSLAAAVLGSLLIMIQFCWFPAAFIIAARLAYGQRYSIRAAAIVATPILLLPLVLFVFSNRTAADPWRASLPAFGANLRIGFQYGNFGSYQALPGVETYPSGHVFHGRLLAEQELGREVDFQEANAHHVRKALGFVLENPVSAASYVLRRFFLFLNRVDIKGEDSISLVQPRYAALQGPWAFGIVVLLATVGLVDARHRGAAYWTCLGLIVAFMIGSSLTMVVNRYKMLAVLPLAYLAAAGIESLLLRLQGIDGSRRRERLAFLGLIGILLGFSPIYDGARDMETAKVNQEIYRKSQVLERELTSLKGDGAENERRLAILFELGRYTELYDAVTAGGPTAAKSDAARTYAIKLNLWLHRYQACREDYGLMNASDRDRRLQSLLLPLEAAAMKKIISGGT